VAVESRTNASLFDSGTLTGATWSHTFTQAGTYPCYCTFHPMMGGTIIVRGKGPRPPNDGGNYIPPSGVALPMKYRFYYTGIRVRNLNRSLAFYTKAIGMKVVNQGAMRHGGKYVQLVGAGSRQKLELNWYPAGSRFHSPYRKGEEMDHLAFVVADVRKAYRELIRKGAKPAVPSEDSEGTEVYLKDRMGSGSSSSSERLSLRL